MNKKEFLEKLRKGLSGIPRDDAEERSTFYSEMIDDKKEEGMTEESAVAELGPVEDIIKQIMSEIPLTKLIREKVKPQRALRVWEIILLVLGSPIWLSLFAALFSVLIAVYAVFWSVIIALWAVELSIAACSAGGAICAVFFTVQGRIMPGIAMLGAGAACLGLVILGYFGCRYATKAILILTGRFIMCIKACFIRKEAVR